MLKFLVFSDLHLVDEGDTSHGLDTYAALPKVWTGSTPIMQMQISACLQAIWPTLASKAHAIRTIGSRHWWTG